PWETPGRTEAALASGSYSTTARRADDRDRRLYELVRSDTNEQRERQLHRLPQSCGSITRPGSTAARSALGLRGRVGGSVRKLAWGRGSLLVVEQAYFRSRGKGRGGARSIASS